MPLSTTNLVEINATKLRVLKGGRLVDVLTLTANGLPDIGDESLVIGQMQGLQAQLNAKASTSALNATAASIGADLDGVEVTLGVVGATVGALGGGRGECGWRGGHQSRAIVPRRNRCVYKRPFSKFEQRRYEPKCQLQ